MSDHLRLPVFVLGVVIAPGGRLPLRVFEPRYLAMVKWCMRHGEGFIVVTPDGDGFAQRGCVCRIVDFDQLPDGCLGLTAAGDSLVELTAPAQDEDGLWWAEQQALPPEADFEPGEDEADLVNLLVSLSEHPAVQSLDLDIDFESASEVGWRLIELLPFDVPVKQSLIELHNPSLRLEALRDALSSLQAPT